MIRATVAVWGLCVSVLCGCGSDPAPKVSRTAHDAPAKHAAPKPPPEDEGLSQEQIVTVVESKYPAVRGCHTMQFGGGGQAVGGVMTVDMEISPEGNVISANVADSTFSNDELESCVLDITRSLQFPKGDGVTEFSWKFRFKAPG